MGVPLVHWLTETIKERLQTLLWGAVAHEVETETLLGYAAGLDRIEDAARQYEADGKTHLAELLRRRATQLSPDAPGSSALPALQHLAEHPTHAAPGTSPRALPSPGTTNSPKRGRGRPPKRDSKAPTE